MKTHIFSRRSFLGSTLAVSGVVLLSGCATDEVASPVPQLSFQHLTAIPLKVSSVKIEQHYKSPMKEPHAEQRFATPPTTAMRGWANARLKAVGGDAVARFIIEDASVVETKLKKTKGLKGVFTYEPTERYDAKMAGRLSVRTSEGLSGEVEAEVTRSVEVGENATLAERELAWFRMVEAMMADFDMEMEKQINGYLGRWVQSR